MSSYDEYYETDDPWERHQQRMELDAHLARCREEETKRRASMARAGELVQHGSVADALLHALVRHLATLRALACTCRAWRAKVREHFASLAQLQLYRHDVSESNAAFVYGPLLKRRPDLRVIFVHENYGRVSGYTIPRGGLKKWMDNLRRRGKWVLDKEFSGDFATFFESRAVAKIPELRLVLPRERVTASRKRPISFTCEELSTYRSTNDYWLGECNHREFFDCVQHKLARSAFEVIAGCHLVAALKALKSPAWLQNLELDLCHIHLDDEGARTVAVEMRKNAPPKRIILHATMSQKGSLGMLGVLAHNRFKHGGAHVDVSCLESLSITEGRLWEPGPYFALCSLLSRSSLPMLTRLSLCNSRLGARHMADGKFKEAFMERGSLHLLEELNLHANNLGKDGLASLQDCTYRMPKLRKLDIGYNYIPVDEEVRFLHWIGKEAQWPCIQSVLGSPITATSIATKTCWLARTRCKWERSLEEKGSYSARDSEDEPGGTDREGHTTDEESGDLSDAMSSEESSSSSSDYDNDQVDE